MTAPKMISEREAVLRERAAARFALRYITQRDYFVHPPTQTESIAGDLEWRIGKEFPLPKIERPRVVRDPEERMLHWTVRNGECALYEVDYPCRFKPTAKRVALWADLLANPTELVDDDGAVSASRPEGRASSEETT